MPVVSHFSLNRIYIFRVMGKWESAMNNILLIFFIPVQRTISTLYCKEVQIFQSNGNCVQRLQFGNRWIIFGPSNCRMRFTLRLCLALNETKKKSFVQRETCLRLSVLQINHWPGWLMVMTIALSFGLSNKSKNRKCVFEHLRTSLKLMNWRTF